MEGRAHSSSTAGEDKYQRSKLMTFGPVFGDLAAYPITSYAET